MSRLHTNPPTSPCGDVLQWIVKRLSHFRPKHAADASLGVRAAVVRGPLGTPTPSAAVHAKKLEHPGVTWTGGFGSPVLDIAVHGRHYRWCPADTRVRLPGADLDMQRALHAATQLLLQRVLGSMAAAGRASDPGPKPLRAADEAADAAAEVRVAAQDKDGAAGLRPGLGPGSSCSADASAVRCSPPSATMAEADPNPDASASSSGASGAVAEGQSGGPVVGSGRAADAAAAAARSQNGAVDASVLHGMLEFFVTLARCSCGEWADREGTPMPVRA